MLNQFNNLTTSPVGSQGLGPDNRYGITQSFSETNSGLSGSIIRTISSQEEFYTGEFSGSTLIISRGELNEDCEQFKEINPKGATYRIRSYNSTDDQFSSYIKVVNKPLTGNIQTWFQNNSSPGLPLPGPRFSS